MQRKTYSVLVLPSAGDGVSYWEDVQAQNVTQAKKLVQSRIPQGWKVGNSVKSA